MAMATQRGVPVVAFIYVCIYVFVYRAHGWWGGAEGERERES